MIGTFSLGCANRTPSATACRSATAATAPSCAAALAHDEQAADGIGRLPATMSRGAARFGPDVLRPVEHIGDEEALRLTTEIVLWQMAATTGAVVLGRAGASALAGHRRLLRVRLDAPPERRVALIVGRTDSPRRRHSG